MKEEKDIIEGNKLIAEFLGWKLDIDQETYPGFFDMEENPLGFTRIDGKHFTFHSSWDWLMLVIGKIAKMKYPVSIYFSHIQNTSSVYELKEGISIVRKGDTLSKPIEIAWHACVEFIKIYNKNFKNK